ncbi:metallophosphoesterase [Haloprofundus sp. MHR1]|uniref:metallophosphoesterase n=1 Tax=Haloprofundus sp. MHR1 TaxID=2572921 RepID=UPI0010BEC8CE|nr:metallophosphoesterase [Haloprofundus sp. MHR1]QCJ46994.1 metallophosphoesterase [Haloprofundus sp. MHR1]
MLTVVSDTHATESHRLRGRTLRAVRDAEMVVHAGDFVTETVLDAFVDEAATFRGVCGNNDDAGIRQRLPAARTVEYAGVRFAVTHTRRGGDTALTLFGRERDADAVIFGHSHRPGFDATGPLALLNPGSHAEPRGYRAAHAELTPEGDGLCGRLCTPDGDVFETFRIDPR